MLYVYCVVDTSQPLALDVPGLGGERPGNIGYRDIGMIVGPAPPAAPEPSRENLEAHDRVVLRLMTDHAVLPVRFGTLVRSEDAARALLASRYEHFAAGLRSLAGQVEFSLTVLWEPPLVPDAGRTPDGPVPGEAHLRNGGTQDSGGPGTAYLLRLWHRHREEQALRTRAERLVSTLENAFLELASGRAATVLATPRLLLRAAYLVPAGEAEPFRDAVRAALDQHPRLRWLLTGPWPPYHFARLEG